MGPATAPNLCTSDTQRAQVCVCPLGLSTTTRKMRHGSKGKVVCKCVYASSGVAPLSQVPQTKQMDIKQRSKVLVFASVKMEVI